MKDAVMTASLRHLFILAALFPQLLAACSSGPALQSSTAGEFHQRTSTSEEDRAQLLAELADAEQQADPSGRKILAMGRVMTLEQREVVRGSCWDYSNTVYNRTGYPNTSNNRQTLFKSNKEHGPYADPGQIRPGDWLFYVNHSYNDIEHSAIFVKWINYQERIALMLSYGGEKRNAPARYLPYDISHVYQITRPGEASAIPAAGDNVVRIKYTTRKQHSAPSPNPASITPPNPSATPLHSPTAGAQTDGDPASGTTTDHHTTEPAPTIEKAATQ